MCAKRARGLSSAMKRTLAARAASAASRDPSTAMAPLATASAMNSAPLCLVPGSATNRNPGRTSRLSAAIPRNPFTLSGILFVTTPTRIETFDYGVITMSSRRRRGDHRIPSLDTEKRRDARDHGTRCGRRHIARGGVPARLPGALGFVEHDEHKIAWRVHREDAAERRDQRVLGITVAIGLFRGAGLAADIISRHVGLAPGAGGNHQPHEVAHGGAGRGRKQPLAVLRRGPA